MTRNPHSTDTEPTNRRAGATMELPPNRPELLPLLQLEKAGDHTYLSHLADININGTIYGGQLIGQAIAAAGQDVDSEVMAHSLQLTFAQPGLPATPMRYEVRPLLNGRRFKQRHVLGMQGERTVLSANVSFHLPEWGPTHQAPMPVVPQPEDLVSSVDFVRNNAHRLDANVVSRNTAQRPMEFRAVDPESFWFEPIPDGHLCYWVRARQPLPDDDRLHQAAMGYLSDFWFPLTSLVPHLGIKLPNGLYIASLNHTIGFHRHCRVDDWLLVESSTPFSGAARGLSQCRVFDRQGNLVATWGQETLLRGWLDVDGRPVAPYSIASSKT